MLETSKANFKVAQLALDEGSGDTSWKILSVQPGWKLQGSPYISR